MNLLTPPVRRLIQSGKLAHLVTLNADGSPQVTIVWIGLDGDEIVIGHLGQGKKVANVRHDPRIALSIETDHQNEMGLTEYVVISGHARVSEGGASELLQRLAHTYLGPEVKFPPMDNPPAGVILRIAPEKVSGVGPWNEG